MKFLLLLLLIAMPLVADTDPDGPPSHPTGLHPHPWSRGLIEGAPWVQPQEPMEIPTKFSWIGAGFDIPVHNQGTCGSCFAFASIQNLEWTNYIFLGKLQMLSEQQLVGDLYSHCLGGEFCGQYEVWHGVYSAADCPYLSNNSKCPSGIKVASRPLSYGNIGEWGYSPKVDQLKMAILQWGPPAVSVAATASWDTYTGGVKESCGGKTLNHMINLIGWDDALGKHGAWIARNQWGKGWGDKGNILLPYGCDKVGAEAATVFVAMPGE